MQLNYCRCIALCVYVCVKYVYTYVYVYAYVCIRMCVYLLWTCRETRVLMYVHVCGAILIIHTYIHTYVRTCAYTRTYAHRYINKYMRAEAHTSYTQRRDSLAADTWRGHVEARGTNGCPSARACPRSTRLHRCMCVPLLG